jgi:hypothetical protein
MTHEGGDDSSFGGLTEFLGDVAQSAQDGVGGLLDGVGSLVDHVTPDDVSPFGGGSPGPGDAPALLDVEVVATTTDVALTVAGGLM